MWPGTLPEWQGPCCLLTQLRLVRPPALYTVMSTKIRRWSRFPLPTSLHLSPALVLQSSILGGLSPQRPVSRSVSVCLVSSSLFAFSVKSPSDSLFLCVCPSLCVSLSSSLLSASLFFLFLCISQSLSVSVHVSLPVSLCKGVVCLPPSLLSLCLFAVPPPSPQLSLLSPLSLSFPSPLPLFLSPPPPTVLHFRACLLIMLQEKDLPSLGG